MAAPNTVLSSLLITTIIALALCVLICATNSHITISQVISIHRANYGLSYIYQYSQISGGVEWLSSLQLF